MGSPGAQQQAGSGGAENEEVLKMCYIYKVGVRPAPQPSAAAVDKLSRPRLLHRALVTLLTPRPRAGPPLPAHALGT